MRGISNIRYGRKSWKVRPEKLSLKSCSMHTLVSEFFTKFNVCEICLCCGLYQQLTFCVCLFSSRIVLHCISIC